MDDLHLERIKGACVIIGESMIASLQSARASIDALAASFLDTPPDPVLEEKERDPFDALMQALNEVGGDIDKEMLQKLAEMAEMAEDMPPIIHKKMPRPPKWLCPVNKANYAANRPPRRARSSCRIRHR